MSPRMAAPRGNEQLAAMLGGDDEREERQRVLLSDLLPFYNTLPSIDVQKRNVGLSSERLFFLFFSLPPSCDADESRWSVLDLCL